jgi:hypothetical protein
MTSNAKPETREVDEQLRDELHRKLAVWGPLVGPDALAAISAGVDENAPIIAAKLCQGDEDVTQDIVCVLGRRAAGWYGITPLGRAIARSDGSPLGDGISYAEAASMLRVSRTRIGQLLAAGLLRRVSDIGNRRGISVASVLDRLDRQDRNRDEE